jgi:predicted kinase
MGMLSRLDTRLYAERIAGRQDDDLLGRVATETVVEFAGWDRTMAEALTRLPLNDRLNPVPFLVDYAASIHGQTPCWENGLVDMWDGQPHVSTLALVAARDDVALSARLWSARVRVVFPFLNAVRLAFAVKYESLLRAELPIVKIYNDRQHVYDDPVRLELFDLKAILEQAISRDEVMMLDDCLKLRRAMAHADPGDAFRIIRASERWERLEPDFPAASTGWEWPRCGQSMVMMVGPSGAGKSTYAQAHYDRAEIVSSDAIREEVFGRIDAQGDQSPVFERLRAEVRARLAAGRRVVVDATHIKTTDRLATARLAPADIPVEYVVLDRAHDEKVATAGWRAERPGLFGAHGSAFATSLDSILAADGLPNVTVTVPSLDGRNVVPEPPGREANHVLTAA